MVCSSYDKLEMGCPTFEERLEILRRLSPRVQRTIVRIQPYMHEVFKEIKDNIPRLAEAGAYGIIIEGMKFDKKHKGLIKIGGDYCYPYRVILDDFIALQEEGHKYGLKVFAGENRIRTFGDSMCCCGIEGLEGFRPNEYNIAHMVNKDFKTPTEAQKEKGTAKCFKALNQSTLGYQKYVNISFDEAMNIYFKDHEQGMFDIFGLTKK